MNSNIGLHTCSNLVDSLEALGATTPESILETLAIGKTIKQLAITPPGNEIEGVVAAGTRESVIDALGKFAEDRTLRDAIGERYGQWERALVKRFLRDLDSEAGDSMFAAIRPTFNKAASAVVKSLEHFGPDTGPEQVVEMDAKALAVWQALRGHRNTLESCFAIASEMDLQFQALGHVSHLRPDSPPLAFVIAEPTRSLNEITAAFKTPPGRNPAGRWARLATVAQLEFRTPSQARATIERLETEAAQQQQDAVKQTHRELKEV